MGLLAKKKKENKIKCKQGKSRPFVLLGIAVSSHVVWNYGVFIFCCTKDAEVERWTFIDNVY